MDDVVFPVKRNCKRWLDWRTGVGEVTSVFDQESLGYVDVKVDLIDYTEGESRFDKSVWAVASGYVTGSLDHKVWIRRYFDYLDAW